LDFYHGSEHLWKLGGLGVGLMNPKPSPGSSPITRLRHGQEKAVLQEIAQMKVPGAELLIRFEKSRTILRSGEANEL